LYFLFLHNRQSGAVSNRQHIFPINYRFARASAVIYPETKNAADEVGSAVAYALALKACMVYKLHT
jgi:hypothetical protein